MKPRHHLLGGYAIWMVLLTALYYALPGLRAVTWGLIGLSGVVAIVMGVVINRPSRKLPWLLLATGLARRSGCTTRDASRNIRPAAAVERKCDTTR